MSKWTRAAKVAALCTTAMLTVASLSGAAVAQDKKFKIYLSLSYSGNSWQSEAANIVKALEYTRSAGIKSYAILGYSGGKALALAANVTDLASVEARPLLGVGQQGIGRGDRGEALGRVLLARVHVGVVLFGEPPVGAADLVRGRARRHAESIVGVFHKDQFISRVAASAMQRSFG